MSKLCRTALQVPRLRQSQRQADKREAEEAQFPQTESQHEKPVHGKGKGRGNLNIFIDLNADMIQLIYKHSLVQYLSFFRQKIEHR